MADEGNRNVASRSVCSPRERNRAVAEIARRRHRLITREQLLAIGFGIQQIRRRGGSGQFVQVHPGVYAVGPGPLGAKGLWLAATLFAPDGLLSHRPSGALWGMLQLGPSAIVHVTSPKRIRAPAGIVAHRSLVPADERTIRHGIPTTSTGRTIFDYAATASQREIERMLNEAYVLGLPVKPSLSTLLERYPRRRGNATARAALIAFAGGPTLTKSDLEERFLAFLARHGFPRPLTNHPVVTHIGTLSVDFVWPVERLVIEVDAPSTHGSRPAMLRDRRRDRALTLAGWRPARIMENDLEDELGFAREIRCLLAA